MGPFLIVIQKMIRYDLLKFGIIYIIFLMGFSQAMYMVFNFDGGSLFTSPFDSVYEMFLPSLGKYGVIYQKISYAKYKVICVV